MAEAGAPRWAPRVSRDLIRRLYEREAIGLASDELIDEVVFAFYARCRSILDATAAVKGSAPCPDCRTVIEHPVRGRETLRCPNCGWQCAWSVYRKTVQGKYLVTWGPVDGPFAGYMRKVESARDPAAKMLAVDWLIMQVHGWRPDGAEPRRGRTVAVNLIEGDERHVMAFLDDLFEGLGRDDYAAARRRLVLNSELPSRRTRA